MCVWEVAFSLYAEGFRGTFAHYGVKRGSSCVDTNNGFELSKIFDLP